MLLNSREVQQIACTRFPPVTETDKNSGQCYNNHMFWSLFRANKLCCTVQQTRATSHFLSHHYKRYRFSADDALTVTKCYLFLSNCFIFGTFWKSKKRNGNKWCVFVTRLLVTKNPKRPFKIGTSLSCLLDGDTALVHPFSGCFLNKKKNKKIWSGTRVPQTEWKKQPMPKEKLWNTFRKPRELLFENNLEYATLHFSLKTKHKKKKVCWIFLHRTVFWAASLDIFFAEVKKYDRRRYVK